MLTQINALKQRYAELKARAESSVDAHEEHSVGDGFQANLYGEAHIQDLVAESMMNADTL